MTNHSNADAREIIAALRSGVVPRRGLSYFASALEPLAAAVGEDLDFVGRGKGASKWIRGEYGTGKTFAARYLCAEARAKGFATSEVQISINDTPLYRLETVYRRLVERLETNQDGQNAFQAVVQAWLYQLGEEVQRLKSIDENDPSFPDATEQRLEDRLADLSRRNPSFAQALRAYHRAQHDGDFATAQGVLGWLAGSPHTDRSVLSSAKLRGSVDGQTALTFLVGILQLLRQSGYNGLVVVLDEAETIQLMNKTNRERSLNALRQLIDHLADDQLPGLYLIVTGTRDFFENYKGVKSLQPLYQRVHVSFADDPKFDNLRAPQVRLSAFTADRLFTVGQRIRDLYPSTEEARVRARVSDAFLRSLVDQVTSGFGGTVAVAPRIFLRELTDVLDRVDQHQDFDPAAHYRLDLDDAQLTPEELAAARGEPVAQPPEEADESSAPPASKRLDG